MENKIDYLKKLQTTSSDLEGSNSARLEAEEQDAVRQLYQIATKEHLCKIYQDFRLTCQEIISQIVDKLLVYGDVGTVKVYKEKFFPFLTEVSIELLSDFYIVASKYFQGKEYLELGFTETDQWRLEIIEIVDKSLVHTPA